MEKDNSVVSRPPDNRHYGRLKDSLVLRRLDNWLGSLRQGGLVLTGLALIGFIGAVDYFSGLEVSTSYFYLIPVALISWYGRMYVGFVLSAVAAITWLIVDLLAGHPYSQRWIYVWNATVRFGFFFVATYILTELKIYMDREKKMARTDPLTGVRNSRAFREEAGLFFKLAARHRHVLALGYIDLDNFKTVNDTKGHAEGDRVLQVIGGMLSHSARGSDIVGRLGGDEFGVLLPDTDLAGARAYFDKLHERLLRAMREGGWPVGFSIGVAVFPGLPPDENEALRIADMLMYRGKRGGKNRVIYEVFS